MFKPWFVCCALATMACGLGAQETPAPEAVAEDHKLERFVGTSKLDARLSPGPGGPGAAISGTTTCRMVEGVQVICDSETIFKEHGAKGAKGFVKARTTITYDPSAKKYRSFSVSNLKDSESSEEGTCVGDTCTWKTETLYKGKKYLVQETKTKISSTVHRVATTMSADGGKTWITIVQGKSVKQ